MAALQHRLEATDATTSIALTTSGDRELIVTLTVDAPRARVFDAFIDEAQLAEWWGPSGFTRPVCEMDPRPGGSYRVVACSPSGVAYPSKGVFREIARPERLVLTDNWEEHPASWQELLRAVARIPPDRAPDTPREALDIVTFEDEAGKTKLTIRARFESATARDAMLTMGWALAWAESLERLESHLARARAEP